MDLVTSFRQAASLAMRSPNGVIAFITDNKKKAARDFSNFLGGSGMDHITHHTNCTVSIENCQIIFYNIDEPKSMRGVNFTGVIVDEAFN